MRLLIFGVILFVSCSHLKDRPSLTYDPNIEYKSDKNLALNNKQISDDLEYLKFTLRNAYSGYFFKNRESVENGIEKLSKNLDSIKNTQDLCDHFARSFIGVRDRHLSFKLAGKHCLRAFNRGRVGIRKFKDRDRVWTVDRLAKKGREVLLIAISRFPSSSSEVWDGFLDKISKELNKVEAVFLDMRGNGGGDDAIGYQLAKLLAGGKSVSTPYGNQHKVVTRAGLESRWNYFILQKHYAKTLKDKAHLQAYIDFDIRNYWGSSKETIIHGHSFENITRHKLIKPIYIIQDADCASSCESTIDFFEYLSPVVRVGESTAGFIHFGNMGFVLLPNSLIQANIASTYQGYLDGRFIEGVGIKPDIEVGKGKDAFEMALKHFISEKELGSNL